jgi:hypothetical protein
MQFQVFAPGTPDIADIFPDKVYDVSGATSFTAQLVQTGGSSLNGKLTVVVSNDIPPYGAGPGTGWVPSNVEPFPKPDGTPLTLSFSAPGVYSLSGQMALGAWMWMAVVYEYTSGTGGTIEGTFTTQDSAVLSG